MSEQEESFPDPLTIIVCIIFGIPVLCAIGFVFYIFFSVIFGGAVSCDPATMCQP